MTLPGGPANKLGNRYEKWWTVSALVDMLNGSGDSLRIEDLCAEKAEFVVQTGSRRQLHQAKRSHPNGKWSLAELRRSGLLLAIGEQLAGNSDEFVFASGSDARELADLCEAASDAESMGEFQGMCQSAAARKQALEQLLKSWACDESDAFGRLRRIKVRTIGERDLEEKVTWGVQALFVDRDKALSALLKIVEDSVHRTITRNALVEQLGQAGYSLRQVTSPENAGIAVTKATDSYLEVVRRRLIGNKLVEREAAKGLISRLDKKASDSVLTGKAGSGKTACVIEIVEELRARGIPVLAFRLDRLPPISTTTQLGQHLDIEESPALVLAEAAELAESPGVLVVDQLDAVSTISGRTAGMFEIVESLLLEARAKRVRVPIHTIVVCRAFDWENDSRLRQLVPDTESKVEVTEFSVDQVKNILAESGFDRQSWGARQLRLLQLPQNLSLFLDAGFDPLRSPTFGTAKEIFDRYWRKKREAIKGRVSQSADEWTATLQVLCNEMTSMQQLSVPKEKLDGISVSYLNQMASEGVIAFDGRRYGFGHESFFDYCFARLFTGRDQPLVSFLRDSEQHLFRRAQVRQVLTYLRDAQTGRYVDELRQLLSDEDIRVHIKDLAFALLAQVERPTEEEWAIWERWTRPAIEAIKTGKPNPDKLSDLAWRRFKGAKSWFAFINDSNLIKDWLASGNDPLVDTAMDYLRIHLEHYPDLVAALLEPYADCGGEWAIRFRNLISWLRYPTSRRFFSLFLRLVDNGTLDDARGPIAKDSMFRILLHGLEKHRPEWLSEVLAHVLRRRLAVIGDTAANISGRELFGYGQSEGPMIAISAQRAPRAFVEHVLPVVLEISDLCLRGEDPPKPDNVWQFLTRTKHPDARQACLTGMGEALAALASENTTSLDKEITALRCRDSHTSNYLLLALYGGDATRYANEAVSLLCAEPWRFKCGFSDSLYWCAMEAIRAFFPHCTPGNRVKLERAVLSFAGQYERTSDGYPYSGRACFDLLSAIPEDLRSSRAKRRFAELQRKFGEPSGHPVGVTGGLVKSPIDKKATTRMTDEQWLRAIAKYDSEWLTSPGSDRLKGGAWELARELEARVQEQPERFAQLSLRFPAEANPVYLDRVLAALAEAAIESNLKIKVCRKAFVEASDSCARSIADVLGEIKDPLPSDAIAMLESLATKHEDPAEESVPSDLGSGKESPFDATSVAGINSVRGRAAEAIRKLIIHDAAYIERLRPTLDLMIQDPSPAVLSCVAGTVRAVAYRDPQLGMSLFRQMSLPVDSLLVTPEVYRFILDRISTHFSALQTFIERMLRSVEPDVCTAGARLACFAALGDQPASSLVDTAMHGSANHRLGLAQVASANIGDSSFRAWCEPRLAELFNDEDSDVQSQAASCFRALDDQALEDFIDLIDAFCRSRAFHTDSFDLLGALENTRMRLPGLTCLVCELFLDQFATESRDISSRHTADAPTVAKLIFRTYQQHQDDEWAERALELIDRLCLEAPYGAQSEFEQFDR